jgi:hypothetical protein
MTAVLEPTLSYSSSIPRAHVHRAAICEVFLTDIICESYPSFVSVCSSPESTATTAITISTSTP